MREKLLAGALALAVLAGGVSVALAGSQEQALVSFSYLNGVFWEDLKAIAREDVEKNTTALYQDVLAGVSGAAAPGEEGPWSSSGSFAARSGVNGDVVSAALGSGLIWTAGTAVVRAGTLVDATSGSEVASGGVLTVGHRYLAGTDVSLVVASETAGWMAEGTWSQVHGEPVEPPVQLPFADVGRDAWYYEDVCYVYQNELFNGQSQIGRAHV